MKDKVKVGNHLVKDLLENEEYQKIVNSIDREIDYVDIKQYSHNIISLKLQSAAKKFGNEVANDLIDEFGLEDLGWRKH